MLGEAHRRAERGTDVVVGFVETHGRKHTAELRRGPRGRPPSDPDLPRHLLHGDGRGRGPGTAAEGRSRGRDGPHQRAGVPEREALAGHRGASGRRDRRHHHRQHPAPRVGQRRGREDHRGAAARDRAGRGGPGGRPDRAGGHDGGGAPAPSGPRQRVRAGEGRRRPVELLPGRQPERAARAGVALDGGPGRPRVAGVPGAARHHRDLGGARARRRRPDRRPGGRDAGPPRSPHRRPVHRRRPARRARGPVGRTRRREPRGARRPAAPGRVARRDLPPGAGRGHPRSVARLRARGERDPAGPRREPSTDHGPGVQPRNGHPRRASIGRHRRPHRHPPSEGERGVAPAGPGQPQRPPEGPWVRARGGAAPRCWPPASCRSAGS